VVVRRAFPQFARTRRARRFLYKEGLPIYSDSLQLSGSSWRFSLSYPCYLNMEIGEVDKSNGSVRRIPERSLRANTQQHQGRQPMSRQERADRIQGEGTGSGKNGVEAGSSDAAFVSEPPAGAIDGGGYSGHSSKVHRIW
jgi:hypothetical protein